MNLSIQPNVRREDGQGRDPLDQLLRDFFQSEMPQPWPGPPLPLAAPPRSSWWARSRSRWALAASVALLVGSSWWLSGHTRDYAAPTLVNVGHGSGNAASDSPRKIRDKVKEQEKRPAPLAPNPR